MEPQMEGVGRGRLLAGLTSVESRPDNSYIELGFRPGGRRLGLQGFVTQIGSRPRLL